MVCRRPCGDCKYCERAEQKEYEQRNELEISPTSVEVRAVQPLGEKTESPETCVPGCTNSELRQEQLADLPSFAKVINWKETSNTRPQLPQQDGVLSSWALVVYNRGH